MNLKQYQQLILDHNGKDSYVQVHKSKIRILSGTRSPIEAAIFLEELLSLTKYHKREWVYRTREDWYKELYLDKWAMRTVIDDLLELEVIETKRKRVVVGKDEDGDPMIATVTHFRVRFEKLVGLHMSLLANKDGWIAPVVKTKRRNVTSSANAYYADVELRDTQMLIKEELEEELEESSSCDDSPSAHHAASQPQPSVQKDHPEERVWDEQTLPSGQSAIPTGDGGSDGDDSKENSPPTPPLSVTKRTRDESKITDADRRQAAYVQRLSDYVSLKVDGHEMSGVHIQAIWDKYEWWYMTGAAGVEHDVLEYAFSKGVDMKPFFVNETPADFTGGTDPHPAPQTPLPDDPGGSTGHSHPDPLAASLAALNPTILQEMALKKMEADKARRKTYAVRNAIEDGTLRAIHELCPQGYEIVLSALRDFAMKPEKMLEWFRKKPNVPRAINTLKKPEYITLRDAAREKAAGFSEGWQQYPALHFFDLVVNGSKASGPKERPMHMKDEPRYHYQNEIQAAKTYEEILAVITKYDEQGLWPQTPRKIKQDGRWTVMRDEKGALVMATPEEHARDRIAEQEDWKQ